MFLIYGFNRIISAACAAVIGPLMGVSHWLALAAISLLTALVALLVFKCCSNQKKIRRAKDIALARILEIRIYKDDLLGIFSAFGRILAATLRYLGLCLLPLIVMILPIGLMLVHMGAWFEYRPLQIGNVSLVTVSASDPGSVILESSSGIRIETDAFILPDQTVTWRIAVADASTPQQVIVRSGGEAYPRIVAAAGTGIYPRLDSTVMGRLANPIEESIPPDGSVKYIEVQHPKSGRHWILGWLVLSMLAGLILKYPLRVEF
ncbi:MAG: hypothetical protein AB7T27_03235 [Kiritimatiellia bacterium]